MLGNGIFINYVALEVRGLWSLSRGLLQHLMINVSVVCWGMVERLTLKFIHVWVLPSVKFAT